MIANVQKYPFILPLILMLLHLCQVLLEQVYLRTVAIAICDLPAVEIVYTDTGLIIGLMPYGGGPVITARQLVFVDFAAVH